MLSDITEMVYAIKDDMENRIYEQRQDSNGLWCVLRRTRQKIGQPGCSRKYGRLSLEKKNKSGDGETMNIKLFLPNLHQTTLLTYCRIIDLQWVILHNTILFTHPTIQAIKTSNSGFEIADRLGR